MSKLSRKQFIKGSLLASASFSAIALMVSSKRFPIKLPSNASNMVTDESFWATVREHFLIDEHVVNLNNGAVGPQPIPVQQSHIDHYQQSNKAPSHYMWKELDNKREPLREALSKLMDCEAEEVAINRNTTEGLNTVIFGLDLNSNDEVVVSDYDYPFMLNAWNQRVMRDGIILNEVRLPLPLDNVQEIVELYRAAITPKTKLVHLTHVINWTGQILPVREITEMSHKMGCEVIVDAAHALAHIPLSFKEINCDYMATSLHKWLGAPFGAGALVIKREKIARIWPLLSAYRPQSKDIRKFELLGTRSFPAEMAALDAIEFHNQIGTKRVQERLHYLKTYWTEKVKDLKGLTIHTSPSKQFSCSMATFSIEGMSSETITDYLFQSEKLHVGKINWNGLDAVRISPHIYISMSELDRLVSRIKKLLHQ